MCLLISPSVDANEWSGFIAVEDRIFFHKAIHTGQHGERINTSLVLQPEYYHRWEDSDQSLTIVPFLRVDANDKERTHADMREFFWQKVSNDWELNIGVKRIFWGVAESHHLVDIINQTDLIENTDEEDKLGQPMVQLSLFRNWGTWDFFVMPYFRERTFPGRAGRLRNALVVDEDQATFDADSEQSHVDWALRWSHVLGDFDIGIAHFSGTSREPLTVAGTDGGTTVFTPHYDLIDQTSLDLQYTKGSWLWKLEALYRSGQGESFAATVGGFEFTFFNVKNTGLDIGLLAEQHYDSRRENAPTTFEDDLFLGTRWALNDTQNTEILAGIVQDLNSTGKSLFIEASRRLTDHWKIDLETRLFHNIDEDDAIAHGVRHDDHVQVALSYYF